MITNKTLGGIAHDAFFASGDEGTPGAADRGWEAAAMAVHKAIYPSIRDLVLEEAARELAGLDCNANDPCDAIRALKSEAKP